MRAGVRRAAQACYGCHVFPDRLPVLYAPGSAQGELAQLARASALQAEGQGFEPPILHITYVRCPAFCRQRRMRSLTGRREGRKR